MRSTVRKEETMPDFMYGVCIGAEGARSGGERSEPERRAPSRSLFAACWVPTFTIRKSPPKQPEDDFLPNTRKIFFKKLMHVKVSLVRWEVC